MAPSAVRSFEATTAARLLCVFFSASSVSALAFSSDQFSAQPSPTIFTEPAAIAGFSISICPWRRSWALLSVGDPPMSR